MYYLLENPGYRVSRDDNTIDRYNDFDTSKMSVYPRRDKIVSFDYFQ